MSELDARVARLTGDPDGQEALIKQYKPFILKCASDYTRRYITDSDDEWSIALGAFAQAMDQYRSEEGSFLSFAKLVIRRRLCDYCGTNQKFSREYSVPPALFSAEAEEDGTVSPLFLQVKQHLVLEEDHTLTDEIEAANCLFADYGFSFFDLTASSPKAEKTKKACATAAAYLLKNPILVGELRRTRQFPLQITEKNTGIPRKILERHRTYLIAAVELLSGDYPGLSGYLRPIREELKK